MSTVQNYHPDAVVPTALEPVVLSYIPVIYPASLIANLQRLREHLDDTLYEAMLNDFVGDPDNCVLRLEPEAMLLKLHEAFLSYCGPMQTTWYFEFIKEAQYLYELQGLAFQSVVHDLQLPLVLAQLSRFA